MKELRRLSPAPALRPLHLHGLELGDREVEALDGSVALGGAMVEKQLGGAKERPTGGLRIGLLHARELLQARTLQHLSDVDGAFRVDPDAVRAPELARLVRTLVAPATNHVAVEVGDGDAIA